MNHWLHLIKRNLYISSSGNIWVACTSSPPPPLHSHKASSLTHEWLFPLHRTVTFTTRGEDWECRQQTPQKKRNGPPSCQCMILPSEQGWSEGETFSTQFLSSNVCVKVHWHQNGGILVRINKHKHKHREGLMSEEVGDVQYMSLGWIGTALLLITLLSRRTTWRPGAIQHAEQIPNCINKLLGAQVHPTIAIYKNAAS